MMQTYRPERPLFKQAVQQVTLAIVCCALGTGGTGCSTALRPVPPGGQALAMVQGQGAVQGIQLAVPRLDQGAYPEDVLDVSAAVYVLIENRGNYEIAVSMQDFTLDFGTGLRVNPVPPQQLAERARPPVATPPSTLLAGPVVGGARGGGYVPAPAPAQGAFRGGFGGARLGGFRGGYGGGPWNWGPGWAGPGYGFGNGYYGPLWGYGWGYGPRVYAFSRSDAVRLALPAGRLPPGGRTGGFLYFPTVAGLTADRRPVAQSLQDGSSVMLHWQVREATNRAVLGELTLALGVSDQP